ncbi:MAG: hypothetical protein LKJ88_01890 [Bacilli bacterium]|jgi:uncharacterized protein YrzB (UPF0473 family)|nr:hypothetical protein [Bacilli bacterium]
MAEEKKRNESEDGVLGPSKEEDKHYIVLTDESGKDTKVELLFSIVYHKTETRYLYVVDPGDEDAVIIFSADDDGNLLMVDEKETPSETMAFLQDTFQAYLQGDLAPVKDGEDEEEEECDDPDCECHHHHDGEENECCEGDDEECHCGCGCEDEKEPEPEQDCCCGEKKNKKK